MSFTAADREYIVIYRISPSSMPSPTFSEDTCSPKSPWASGEQELWLVIMLP